jgi:erythromycin esterase
MKILYTLLSICTTLQAAAQDQDIIAWINSNAIVIEDAAPDTPLNSFSAKVPEGFKNAMLFGFGEASHHGKEFFDIKAKFFKYLVEHQGVRLFLMEESYQAEKGINSFITGGQGNARDALNYFNMAIWYTNEMASLLQWMRDYNLGKATNEQIRFYGIDNQFGKDINVRLRDYIKKYNLTIQEQLLVAADSCSAAQLIAGGIKGWDKKMLPVLKEIRQVLKQNKEKLAAANASEYYDMLRGLGYLEQYTSYIATPYNHKRDRDMYQNMLDVLDSEPGTKAFVWAHNEHINKKDMAGYKIETLGSRLKKQFGANYYSVGFDFGSGKLTGYNIKNGKNLGRVIRILDKPYKNTYAQTLIKAQPDVYFIDMAQAIGNNTASKFFSTKMQQLFLGGPGFDPDNIFLFKRKLAEVYDGIIFVKHISPTTY